MSSSPADVVRRVRDLWMRHELHASLAVIAVGFVAVFLGWLEASGTADVRIQMQDLISGAVGGLALILVGATLAHAAVADRLAGRNDALLRRLVDRLDDAADVPTQRSAEESGADLGGAARAAGAAGAARRPRGGRTVLATHASYHQPGCDLVTDPSATAAIRVLEAQRRGLTPCRVCVPGDAT